MTAIGTPEERQRVRQELRGVLLITDVPGERDEQLIDIVLTLSADRDFQQAMAREGAAAAPELDA